MEFTQAELQRAWDDDYVIAKIKKNPLKHVLLSLVKLLETDSEESQVREKEKFKELSQQSQSQSSASFETPDHKRKISDTSFGTRSTDTTPTKLDQPEAKVQSLQNKFVDVIITELWAGKIHIPWAEGRRMFLTYEESRGCLFFSDDLEPVRYRSNTLNGCPIIRP